MSRLLACLLGIFLIGCSPHSTEDFQLEGEVCCRRLIKDLQKIENHDQLLRAEGILKKHFEKLVDLMIEARVYQQKHLDEMALGAVAYPMSEPLKEALRRIYTIEGGRELVEKTQHEALVRLDACEKAITKKINGQNLL